MGLAELPLSPTMSPRHSYKPLSRKGLQMSRRSPDPTDRQAVIGTAVGQSYLRYGASLKRVEDVAQEAFLRAYAVERNRPIAQPKSFLFRIAKHVALSTLDRKARQITDYIEDVDHSAIACADSRPEEELSAQQVLGLHCEAIAALRPQCRRAYLLRKVHGLSHKEIAEHLGLTVSTVEKHLIKALAHCERYVRKRVEGRTTPSHALPDAEEAGR